MLFKVQIKKLKNIFCEKKFGTKIFQNNKLLLEKVFKSLKKYLYLFLNINVDF